MITQDIGRYLGLNIILKQKPRPICEESFGDFMSVKKLVVSSIFAIILLVLVIWTIWGNTALELNTYTVKSEKLPENFSGYRIAQVSDLHNAEIGADNEKLLDMLLKAKPDIIVITGDLIDANSTDIEIALQFAEKALKVAPCYYVTGNHEAVSLEYEILKSNLLELGVIILSDQRIELEKNGQIISLLGVDDPSFQTDYLLDDAGAVMSTKLQTLKGKNDAYTILLSHRPELIDTYVESGVDLVITGHAHGGQFRLPFIGGLIAPNQGLFPEYDSGLYTSGNTNMIVSRGIGNSIIPFRFNNRPEVVLIELVYCL